MTVPKFDLEKTARTLAKLTNLPLPRVARIMQKYPIDKNYITRIETDLYAEQKKVTRDALKTCGFKI